MPSLGLYRCSSVSLGQRSSVFFCCSCRVIISFHLSSFAVAGLLQSAPPKFPTGLLPSIQKTLREQKIIEESFSEGLREIVAIDCVK